jgi:hypothetical protein
MKLTVDSPGASRIRDIGMCVVDIRRTDYVARHGSRTGE